MPRTSTLKAAAAALGLLTGFVMVPQAQGPLDRDVRPYEVTVAWHVGAPPELPSVSGVQMDDWGGRLAPAPRPAVRTAPAKRPPARTPAARPKAETRAQQAMAKPHDAATPRASELAAATDDVRHQCAREEAHEHALHGASES